MDYNQNGMGYDPNNMGYDQNGMGYDQGNNMGYNPNGGQMGGYPQQQMPQQQMPMQPMQQQQMMQQQRFGGMQQGYGMSQPMQQQSMQQDYGMPQQNPYDQGMSFESSSSNKLKNQIPIIIAMVLVLVVGGVIIWFLLKDNDSGSSSSKKKSKEETKIEIKAPSKAYSGSVTDYNALKKYYEDSYKISCHEDESSCMFTFSEDIYLDLEKSGTKLKQVMVGDKNKNSDTYTILLAPFTDTGEKKEELQHALSWMDEGLMYSDQEFEISITNDAVIIRPEQLSKANDNLIELKENNKFTLSNIEFGKKYTVDVQHFNNNFKKTQLRSLEASGDRATASYNYQEDGYDVRVSYRIDEDKVDFSYSGYTTTLKEYNDESRPEKGGRWCYTDDGTYYELECYDYVYLGESSMGHGYGVYFITRTVYTFEAANKDLRSTITTKASDYIKKLHSGIKVVG